MRGLTESNPLFAERYDQMTGRMLAALLEAEVKRIAASKVSEAMSTKVVTVSPETTIDEIATLMVDRKFHTLPVTRDGLLVGVVGMQDIIRTLMPKS